MKCNCKIKRHSAKIDGEWVDVCDCKAAKIVRGTAPWAVTYFPKKVTA